MRCYICDYILPDYPKTLFHRWFKSISAAKAFAARLPDPVYVEVHHA
jgi:hypothetical protein